MYDTFLKHLKSYKNTKISLGQIETWADPHTMYPQFHQAMQTLLDNQILIPVRSSGTNAKNPPLPMAYHIQKSVLSQPIKQKIKQAQLQFHPSIRLDAYFRFAESRWSKDLPYIRQVHDYLTQRGFPQREATAPDRQTFMIQIAKIFEHDALFGHPQLPGGEAPAHPANGQALSDSHRGQSVRKGIQ